eukprot:bmy_16984T0
MAPLIPRPWCSPVDAKAETGIHLLGRVAGPWWGGQSAAARASPQSFLEGARKFAVSPITILRVVKFPENRNRHIYRDVSPYDHSLDIEEGQRSYILTEYPLPNTGCHFWLVVWQQKTKALVILNRIVEKESVKCAQYWPTKGEGEMLLEEMGLMRESGSLYPEHGPVVICRSAGIGQSGTFSLVDTCLVLMEKGVNINIKQLLLSMRKC